jgi:hypothetical protein
VGRRPINVLRWYVRNQSYDDVYLEQCPLQRLAIWRTPAERRVGVVPDSKDYPQREDSPSLRSHQHVPRYLPRSPKHFPENPDDLNDEQRKQEVSIRSSGPTNYY